MAFVKDGDGKIKGVGKIRVVEHNPHLYFEQNPTLNMRGAQET